MRDTKGEGSQGEKTRGNVDVLMLRCRGGGGVGGWGGRKRLGSELTVVLKPDPRLLWDQFDQAVSTIDERPPDDPAESKEDRFTQHQTGIKAVWLSQ